MKKIVSLFLLFVILALLLVSCVGKNGSETETEEKPRVSVRVYTLNGTTGFGMAKLMSDAATGAVSYADYRFTVRSDASDVTAALLNGSADIGALPTNAAANLFNVSSGEFQILAVNTLGCLYLLTKEGTSVESFADLRGKTVYVPAQNPTFLFSILCQKNGLTVGTDISVNSTAYASAANLRDAVAGGAVEIAVLPEPMVTIALSAAAKASVGLTVALDLTAEWDRVCTPGSLVQGCVVASRSYIEAHPETVSAFLADYQASIGYLTDESTRAAGAALIAENGIFSSAAIAEAAIPKCNLTYLDSSEMKAAMQVYLGLLYDYKPASIGGALPGDSFYYAK